METNWPDSSLRDHEVVEAIANGKITKIQICKSLFGVVDCFVASLLAMTMENKVAVYALAIASTALSSRNNKGKEID